MKTNKKYVIIFIVTILIIGLIFLFNPFSQSNDNKNAKDKALSEIQYLENKFVNIFNSLNNIQYENYKVFSDTINENDGKENKTETLNTNINWKNLKNEIESIYTSLPTITLDLYNINLNKNDILAFNKEFDILASEINAENKQNTLNQLTKLYKYLPKFLDNTNADKKYKIILETKFHILESYSLLDSEDWEEIDSKINDSINKFKELLTYEDSNQAEQYNINKCYIMLNELKNAAIEENNEIFLIKYKNLLEEISNI